MVRKSSFFIILTAILFASVFSFSSATQKIQDFGIKNPGLLPISPFYFLKEWRRDLTRAFTSNPVSQVILELNIVDEKGAELKKVIEIKEGEESSFKKAFLNYQTSVVDLQSRLKKIDLFSVKTKENSKLLNEVFSRVFAHEKFLKEISEKYSGNDEISSLAEKTKKEVSEAAVTISGNIQKEVFISALKDNFSISTTTTSTVLSDIEKSKIEIIEQMKEVAPIGIKKEISEIYSGILPFYLHNNTSTSTATSTEATSTIEEKVENIKI